MNRLMKILWFFILMLLLSACSVFEQRSRETEESAIYSLLLNEDPEDYLGGSNILIILNENDLDVDTTDEIIFERAPLLEEETLADLRSANQERQPFDPKLSLEKPYKIIDSADMILRIGENEDWVNPFTVTTFSRVGFNKHLDQALVYMEHYAGSEWATGNLYFLVRTNDIWKIETIVVGSVS